MVLAKQGALVGSDLRLEFVPLIYPIEVPFPWGRTYANMKITGAQIALEGDLRDVEGTANVKIGAVEKTPEVRENEG